MASNAPQVRVDRVTLTDIQLKALELMLYQMADTINRLRPNGEVQYTKIEAAALEGGQ